MRIYNTVDLTHGKEVELLVDSGSIHTVIPSEVLEELKIKPIEEMDVEVFRGVIVRRKYGIAVVEYENKFRESQLSLERIRIHRLWELHYLSN